ncbi:hypothetical protein JB92DRAFT_2909214 [Gautieria morchelliformis]|nr:hypothetical protein JB92DRAFT_2909214 [Gautieria morchelliformis]
MQPVTSSWSAILFLHQSGTAADVVTTCLFQDNIRKTRRSSPYEWPASSIHQQRAFMRYSFNVFALSSCVDVILAGDACVFRSMTFTVINLRARSTS